MKKLLPIIAALSIVAVYATAQTTYLGNILQMHRQVEPLPTPTDYEGAIVYNRDAGALYFSNGTIWAPIAGDGGGSGGSSDGVWVDAGTPPGVSDGGFFGVYLDTVPQTLVGATNISFAGVPYTPVDGLNNPNRNPNVYVFRDGGTALMAHTRHNVPSLSRTSFLPISAAYQGANLYLYSDTTVVSASNYAQLLFQANNPSTPSSTAANDYITSYRTGGAIGSDGAFANGLNLHAGTNGYVTLSSGGDTSNFPALFVAPNSQISMGQGNVTAGTTVTLNSASLTTGLSINSAVVGISFASNSMDLDLGTGSSDYFESNGTRIVSPGGLNVLNARITGNTDATTTVTSTTSGNGGIGFNQASGTHYMMATNKEARPILSGPDWVYDGRTFELEVTHELTACPVVRKNMSRLGSGGGDITVFCDEGGGTPTVSVGAGHPAQPYRNFVTSASAGQRAIVGGFTTSAPASGASATPQTFVSRQAGPMFGFRLRTGSAGWTSNVTWYAGMFSTIPTSGSPYGSSVYLRFDTNNPLPSSTADTRFRLCGCNSGTCTCSNLSVAPAASTEYLFEVDCRESSSACYVYMNGLYETSVTTNLPGTSTPMGFAFAIENVDATARTAGLGRLRIRQE